MEKAYTHTTLLFRCLLILGGVMLFSSFSVDKTKTKPYAVFDYEWVELAENGDSSENSEGAVAIPGLEIKEAPRQQQAESAPNSTTLLKQGNTPSEPDSKDLSQDRSLIHKALMLLPEKVPSGTVYRLTIHLLSYFLSLPGDIAINAP